MDQRVQQLLDEGADEVCYKPFNMPKLLAALKGMTDEKPGLQAVSRQTPR
jgi:DNA-binding response OmpR family regulator